MQVSVADLKLKAVGQITEIILHLSCLWLTRAVTGLGSGLGIPSLVVFDSSVQLLQATVLWVKPTSVVIGV